MTSLGAALGLGWLQRPPLAAASEGERSGGPSTRLKRPSGSGNISRQTVLEAADVTTIDEISMANKELVETIDDLLGDAVGLMDGSGVRSLFSLFDMYNNDRSVKRYA